MLIFISGFMKEAIINYIILLFNRPLKLNPIYKPFYLSPPAPPIAGTGSILLPALPHT